MTIVPYDTTGQTVAGLDPTAEDGGFVGFSFATTVTSPLTQVELDLQDSNPADGGTATVTLFSDNGGAPGTLIATIGQIDDSSLSSASAGAIVTLDVPSGIQLSADTTYWIEISGSAASGVEFAYESSDAGTGASGQSYDDDGQIFSNSGGAFVAAVFQGSGPQVPYDTIGQTVTGLDPAPQTGGVAGFSFTTAITSSLTEVDLDLADGNPADGGTVTVTLYSDNGGAPGTLIATLGQIDDSSLSSASTGAVVHLEAPPGVQLSADTTYWIEVSGSATSGVEFAYEASDAGVGASGQSYDDNGGIFSNSGGAFIAAVDQASAPCFCRGTFIRTPCGNKRVEKLQIGDEVMTASGAARPIKWIGRRSYLGRFVMGSKDILPVCIKAGALADNLPRRDLWISPNHAMYLDGVLIEAKDLVNGVSIVQAERVEQLEYFHIELETHDVIVAEGALAETYIDDDNRLMFHNAHEYREHNPAVATATIARYCAPRLDEGYELETIRRRITLRAGLKTKDDTQICSLRGFVDRVTSRVIEGWAQNVDHPDTPICLDIFAGGILLGQVLANRYREDLKRAGIGSGHHSFAFTPPAVFVDLDDIEVRRSLDGASLKLSPSCQANIPRRERRAA